MPSTKDPRDEAFGLRRVPDDQVLSGVAAAVGARLGVDPLIVRLGFIVLSTAAGVGGLLYVVLLWRIPSADARPVELRRPASARHALGLALTIAGVLLLLRDAGVWLSDSLTWSVALAALGSGLVWTRAADDERARWRGAVERAMGEQALPDARAIGPIRLVLGAAFVIGGGITFVVNSDLVGSMSALLDVLIASVVTLVGVALVIGPWLQRLGGQVAQERRERIRSEERAEMAAHLHDSVLQTLALIQRATAPEEVQRLARRQERELRAWLFGRSADDAPLMLGQAVHDVAGRVEDAFGVTVEVVLAGDVPLDEDVAALVDAAGEAMTNAAKHSGAVRVDVFVEVGMDALVLFVRDEGRGFDAAEIGRDRRGLSSSIHERMRRHGGTAEVTSSPGEGTEVELVLPRPGQSGPAAQQSAAVVHPSAGEPVDG